MDKPLETHIYCNFIVISERNSIRGGDPSQGPPRRVHHHLRPLPPLRHPPARRARHLPVFQVRPKTDRRLSDIPLSSRC